MRHSRLWLSLGMVAALACQEGTGPEAAERAWTVEDGALHSLRWSGARTLSVEGSAVLAGQPQTVGPVGELGTYSVTFWAHAGRDNVLQVNYAADSGNTTLPFLRLTIPRYSLWRLADGASVGSSDSVRISLEIDDESLHVDLGPSGLQFRPWVPAFLEVWYAGADPDFNGDGAVNAVDTAIEVDFLGLWVQADPGSLWERLTALHSVDGKWFKTALQHFSGYEVSY